MVIFVGLGNPGEEYADTRHNVGWLFLDFIAKEWKMNSFETNKKIFSEMTKSDQRVLIKPQTYMNESGKAVQAAIKWFADGKVGQHVFLIHDDLDIETGKYKIQFGTAPKIHNGVNSVREQLGTDQFWNVRIGIDGRKGDRTLPGREYVLQRFTPDERDILNTLFKQILEDLEVKV